MTPRWTATTLLAGAEAGRAAQKRLGAALDADPALRAELCALARSRGVALPEEAEGWPGKRLLRLALGRAEQAQVRRNPIRRDEAFACAACGAAVPPGGARVRDHCPRCLCSMHVDEVPGDRASTCGGLLRPVRATHEAGEWVLGYRCERCAAERRCRAHPDDDPALLRRLTVAG